MAVIRIHKISGTLILFTIGLFLGLLISYGIRWLSKPNCSPVIRENAEDSYSKKSSTPDQVLNLAFSSGSENHETDLDKSISSSSKDSASSQCESGETCEEKSSSKTRNLLFVGVMTANVFLETRAKAVWETWAKEIPGKVVFFTGGSSYSGEGNMSHENDSLPLPLVPLLGVDDSYPPQKKSFMMLKYMYDNYGNDYDWFMRADDDVYVRGDKLSEFLLSIDCRHLHFIGQAGRGNQVEKGTLNLGSHENFCMGGPGIIMSRPTLKKVAPNVQECLKDMYSTHEDVEVGRCVKRFAGVSCTWAYEMQTIFHHNSSGESAFTGKLKRREVHKAITLHPVKDFKNLYRIHVYFQGLKIQELMQKKIQIHRDILEMSRLLAQANISSQTSLFREKGKSISSSPSSGTYSVRELNITGLPPSLNKYLPKELENVISWDFLGKGLYSPGNTSPKLKLKSDSKEALEDVVREVMDAINGNSHARGRMVDFKQILYGYKRVNPLHGADYILDLLMTYRKYRGKKMTIPVRRHVYVQRSFGPLQMRLVPVERKNFVVGKMVMIVPLSGRFETFQRFLDNFVVTCKDLYSASNRSGFTSNGFGISSTPSELNLIVVLFGSDDGKERYLNLIQERKDSLEGSVSVNGEPLCKIKMVQIDAEFSRGVGLETGISQCNDDDLLFLIDVDLTFTTNVVRRAILNTRQGTQAYFPIVFSQYNPNFYSFSESDKPGGRFPESCSITRNRPGIECINSDFGYWREFGYGIASFYKSDFRQAGGYDLTIKGWGKEDVALFDRFLQHTNLTIFRAPDPELVHIFHETECDHRLPKVQLDMCHGSQASTLGSERNLMNYLVRHKHGHIMGDLRVISNS